MPPINSPVYSFAQAKRLMARHIQGYASSKDIVRFEIRVKPLDQLDWLCAQKATIKVFGANQDDRAAIAGVGEAMTVRGTGRVNYPRIFKLLRRRLSSRYPYLQWYGGFGFDARNSEEDWKSFGSWRFILPRFELARDKGRMIFCCNLIGVINAKTILDELSALKVPVRDRSLPLKFVKRRDYPQRQEWRAGVLEVLKSIRGGRAKKVVLARRTDFFLKAKPDPWRMLKTLKQVTPNSYHFAFQFCGPVFLGASPERLYKRFGRALVSEALAGTKPRTIPPQELLGSAKDRHEHQLVVEGIAKSLGPLCDQLTFSPRPTITTLSNGHHLNTVFKGHLKDGVQDEDVLQSLHPTPAVGGVPGDFALKTIRRLELFRRGWYAGPLGYVGLDWAEFVVGIRSGLLKSKRLSVFAGAGIVQGSQPESEWREIENKISNFIKIIE